MDSNDGGSLESGPGSRLGDCGHRQEAWLADQNEVLQDHGDYMSEKDKSLAEIRQGTTTDFGVTSSRSSISRHLRMKLKKVRTFRLRETNKKKRRGFCEKLLPRLKLGKARVQAKCRPGIDVQSIVLTDEKFFRLEQEDKQQRVWLDSVTTKKVREKSAPPAQSHAPLSVVKPCTHCKSETS